MENIRNTMTSSYGNVLRGTGLFLEEYIGHRWITLTKGQWRRALVFCLMYDWTKSLTNSGVVGDLRSHAAHMTQL